MKRIMKGLAILGVASCLAGCGRDFSVDFELQNLPQGSQSISVQFEQILLEEGFGVAVIARPMDNSDKMDWETQLELEPSFNGVFDIERMPWDQDLEERKDYDLRDGDWGFLMWGMAPGQGNIEVYVDGEYQTDIPVTVNAQPDN